VDVGSTFTVALPAPIDDDEADLDLDRVLVRHVLLVDDDAAFRHVVRGLLQNVAERVSEASDGQAALAAARAVVPDIILLDLRMPGMDGPAMLSQLRLEPTLRGIPVVLITNVDVDAEILPMLGSVTAIVPKSQLTRRRLVSILQEIVETTTSGDAT
jgi:CheY-like chemotaxis protein